MTLTIAQIAKMAADDAGTGTVDPTKPGVSAMMDGTQHKGTSAAGGHDIRIKLDTVMSRMNPHRIGRKVGDR